MPEAFLPSLLADPVLIMGLKAAGVLAGFLLGVRLLAAGRRTADDHDRTLLQAARRHRPLP